VRSDTVRTHDGGYALPFLTVLTLCLLSGVSCSRASPPTREYQLKGQVLAVDAARQEITIKHEDIARFMPAMTMAFRVRDGQLLAGRAPGDLVRATLVVQEQDIHLKTLERVGFEPITEADPGGVMRVLAPGEPVVDTALVDHHGVRRPLEAWRGAAIAVTFIYTRCPLQNFCPLMDRQFKDVQEQVMADPQLRGKVRLVSVSFDPEHDTPAVLARHAANVQARSDVWLFMTGAREEVDTFARQFGVSVLRSDARDAEIVHNLRTAVIDADGRLSAILNGNEWSAADLVAELRKARAGR
jgi:protein SCO1/2